MEQDYRIETLISIFADHAKKAEQQHQEMVAAFKENNPNEDLPSHMANAFNVSQALSVMCGEIEKLKTLCN